MAKKKTGNKNNQQSLQELDKIEDTSQLKRGNIPIKVRCGNCMYFQNMRVFKKPCKQLGVMARDKPCKYFSVDPYQIDFNVRQETIKLKELLNSIEDKQLPIFAALLNQHIHTREMGFKFGQTVYIRLFQEDYLSNFSKARVIMAHNGMVYLQGYEGTTFRGTIKRENVWTKQEFRHKRRELKRKNKITDPNYAQYTKVIRKRPSKAELEEELDKVQNKSAKKSKKKKNSRHKELTEVFDVRGS